MTELPLLVSSVIPASPCLSDLIYTVMHNEKEIPCTLVAAPPLGFAPPTGAWSQRVLYDQAPVGRANASGA